jgi:hypothetical protein
VTRRERLERRLERRQEWAASRERSSGQNWDAARRAVDGIPFGQPILVGHHSEKRHRAALDRADSKMRHAAEDSDMAKKHAGAALGIEHQLDRTIFSDDANAVEALEAKAAAIEADCERMKRVNAAYRKAPGADSAAKLAACIAAGTMTEKEARSCARLFGLCHWERQPFPAYALSNARANARRCRERVKAIQHQAAQTAKAEAAPGGVLVEVGGHGIGAYARVTFPDYPGRPTVEALKAAGFHWSRPSWYGSPDKLPECVREMIETPEA